MSSRQQKLDSAVRTAYDSQPHAVDAIAFNPRNRERFLELVRSSFADAEEEEALKHLEKLRKRGSRNGGLPRKAR
ncbi:hypothetical protein Pan14r_04420 [Crateriforma conspicua]|uniref:Uncharacterized protein n=1 Tax=Crateriforma conspicua TaxID=2527996 RepID=A0A5C5XYY7_9PLAN|nr:hypothetical protein Pan14r_04420 [Crateriforma conspicua]